MNILPLQPILSLRLTLISPVAYSQDTETVHILRDIKHATNHLIGSRPVVETTTTHLDPAAAQSQVLSLILHRDGSD